jgi:hypothetical protein
MKRKRYTEPQTVSGTARCHLALKSSVAVIPRNPIRAVLGGFLVISNAYVEGL